MTIKWCNKMSSFRKEFSKEYWLYKEDLGHNPTDRSFKGIKISVPVDAICYSCRKYTWHEIIWRNYNWSSKKAITLIMIKILKWIYVLIKDIMVLQLKLYHLSIIIAAIFNREEKKKNKIEGYKPRRWVAERGIAWMKGNRSIRTRYCQKLEHYQSVVYIGCSMILMRPIIIKATQPDELRATLDPETIRTLCCSTTWHDLSQEHAV